MFRWHDSVLTANRNDGTWNIDSQLLTWKLSFSFEAMRKGFLFLISSCFRCSVKISGSGDDKILMGYFHTIKSRDSRLLYLFNFFETKMKTKEKKWKGMSINCDWWKCFIDFLLSLHLETKKDEQLNDVFSLASFKI
jgi:hypothetical protein